MFIKASEDVHEYVLEYDRQSDVQTVWHLKAQNSEDTQGFLTRYNREAMKRGGSDEVRGQKLNQVDKQQLQRVLVRVDNCFEEGDKVVEPEDLRRAIDLLDYNSLQELLRASQNVSVLGLEEKNS